MTVEAYRGALVSQMKAALATLSQCIETCPEHEWNEAHGDAPFSQVVFHTLFFTDYYLEPDDANPTLKDQDFHRQRVDFFKDYEELEWKEPRNLYDRSICREYLAFCISKCERTLAEDDAESLFGPSGFTGKDFSRAELYIYVARHIQHHAAQLGLRVQLITGKELSWVKQG